MLQITRKTGQTIKIGDHQLLIKKIHPNKVQIELPRKIGEKIVLDDHVSVIIMDIQRKQARLGIKAPKNILISWPEKQKRLNVNLPKILVVEDHAAIRLAVRLLLEQEGYTVDIAPTGEEALYLHELNSYDIILMDMNLPDIRGTDVTRKIREKEKENKKRTPIIAHTSNDISAKSECLASGMDDFLTKPFEIDQLNSLIKSWIKN